MTSAHKTLGLEPGCGVLKTKQRWRQLASVHHPDREGGDAATFSRLRLAYDMVLPLEEDHDRTCKACQGIGSVIKATGFYQKMVRCTVCGGIGRFPK